uniref:Uncharacterized protein n=1 Tax=Panagrolaimus davidi TaxID=227884 RepID=A0A914QFA6_9BILA
MDTKFKKCGVREFDQTIHSIFSATHPETLKLFNMSEEIAKKNTMFGATLLVATQKALEIVKKWKECAIEKECMAPEGSHRACDIPKLYKNEYGNCHRFDQSTTTPFNLRKKYNPEFYPVILEQQEAEPLPQQPDNEPQQPQNAPPQSDNDDLPRSDDPLGLN